MSTTSAPVHAVQPPTGILSGALWQAGSPVDYQWAAQVGIDVVLDLSDRTQRPDAHDIVALEYRKVPLRDGVLPDVDLLHDLVEYVVDHVKNGNHVLVHCTYGQNRSGLVVGLAVRELLGISGAEALAHVRQMRPMTLHHPAFAGYLQSLPPPVASIPVPTAAPEVEFVDDHQEEMVIDSRHIDLVDDDDPVRDAVRAVGLPLPPQQR